MSAVSCFFGAELKPDGVPFSPLIPPGSSLVITQCAVTAAVPSAAPTTSSTTAAAAAAAAADSGKEKEKEKAAAVPATFSAVTLYVQSSETPSRLAVCTLSPGQQLYFCPLQLLFDQPVSFTLVPQHKPMRAGAPVAYPSVHLTGYYEKEEEDEADGDGEEDEEEDGGEA